MPMLTKNGIFSRDKTFIMFCLGACSKGVTPLVILDEGTVDHIIYIETLLPVPLKYGNQVFGSD